MTLSLQASAALLGRMRYVELAAFSRLGRRARLARLPAVAAFLSGASLAHAWRAGLLEEHLPVSATLPGAAELTVSPGPRTDAALDLLDPADLDGGDGNGDGGGHGGGGHDGVGDVALVAALAEVLYPAMLAGYDARLALASPVGDPPLVRTLGRVRHDLETVAAEARALAGSALVAAPAAAPGLAGALAGALGPDGPFGPIGQCD